VTLPLNFTTTQLSVLLPRIPTIYIPFHLRRILL
jgi:hypothetical protein